MRKNRKISCSIVLYNNVKEDLDVINCILECPLIEKVFLIDNSPTDVLRYLEEYDYKKIEYHFQNENLGYGRAHNIAMIKSIEQNYYYHIVLNPDITFSNATIQEIYNYCESNDDTGQVMPLILYPDGTLQKLVKRLPTPYNLLARRFLPNSGIFRKWNDYYELSTFDYSYMLKNASLSGCFMFLRLNIVKKVGFFDSRFFMYLEDYDLTRRICEISQTVYLPTTPAFHGFKKESYANSKLLMHHVRSAAKYFNKWGWFFDRKRKNYNKEIDNQIRIKSGVNDK